MSGSAPLEGKDPPVPFNDKGLTRLSSPLSYLARMSAERLASSVGGALFTRLEEEWPSEGVCCQIMIDQLVR